MNRLKFIYCSILLKRNLLLKVRTRYLTLALLIKEQIYKNLREKRRIFSNFYHFNILFKRNDSNFFDLKMLDGFEKNFKFFLICVQNFSVKRGSKMNQK